VTDTTQSSHLRSPRSRFSRWYRAGGRRVVAVFVILAAIIGAYVLGLEQIYRDLANSKQLVLQLQTESQKTKDQIAAQNATLIGLRTTLAQLQSTLDELMPSKGTYRLAVNQSLIVAGGRITVGLVGAPSNQAVTLNINGKQQVAAPGDVIDAPPDCRVRVQSFDMFKATITATCGAQ
jgi:FlaG/FlaF family flagellin (archaellin)